VSGVTPKLLTGAQRRALEKRVRLHSHNLRRQIHEMVEADKEPIQITKARKTVELWDAGRDKRIGELQARIDLEEKLLMESLLFDPADECLRDVQIFEEKKL
jgi:hypothetical protein